MVRNAKNSTRDLPAVGEITKQVGAQFTLLQTTSVLAHAWQAFHSFAVI